MCLDAANPLALDPRVVVPGVQRREEPIQGQATSLDGVGVAAVRTWSGPVPRIQPYDQQVH